MSVRVVRYEKKDCWLVDVRTHLPSGAPYRVKKILTVSKTNARRWGEQRERHLLLHGLPQQQKEVPTLIEFAPRFIDGHARANHQKPSTIAAKEMIFRRHLIPALGARRLDAITTEQVQRLKLRLGERSPKTINNVVSALNVMLKRAVEWGVIDTMPCVIKLLPVPKASGQRFHDFEQFDRLLQVTRFDPQTRLIVLLGGDAGLRCGEMIALEWTDVDLAKRQLCVERSDWNGLVRSPKGGRLRYVPLTTRLAAALREHRHLRSARVLCEENGAPLTRQKVQYRVKLAARRAHVREGVHLLRHTFCSHLAMKGAPTKAIQELAGHAEIGTTQRYMHLSPAALDAAIRLLESGSPCPVRGAGGDTAHEVIGKANG